MVVSDPKVFRLSTQQERLWPLLKVSQAFRAQCAVLIEGKLNTALFFSVFQSLIDQHDILRTAFYHWPDMEIPLQVVTPQVSLYCPVIDVRDLSGSQQATLLDKYFSAFLYEDLDLEYDTQLNTILVHLSAEKYMLFICLPALCADGPTLARIVQSLLRAYASCLTGEDRAEEPLQYVDVSAWQNELLAAEDAEAQIQYWRGVDLARLYTISLPFERRYPSVDHNLHKRQDRTFTPGVLDIDVEATLANQLQELAQQFRVSVSHILLACWQVLLWHLDETNGIVGVICDGRNYEELSDGIGLYARIVPMSVTLDGSLSFEQVVHMIDDTWHEVVKRQVYFTWELVRNDALDDQQTFPFFPISFEYDTWPASSTSGPLTSSLWRRYCCTDLFTLKLLVLQTKGQLQFSLHYDAQNYRCERAERLSCLLKQVFESVVNTPQATMNALPILPVHMQERLLQISCAPTVLHPAQGLHQLFETQVTHASDRIAVVSRDEQLTYEALNDLANQLARLLLRQGIGHGAMVGLYVQRSVSMIIGMLAILKAGGAYVPLDPEIPPARLAYQLHTAQAQALLSQQTLLPRVGDWNGKLLCLETSMQEMHQELRSNLPSCSEPGDIAYVIYTSGSTGKPKGVAIQHRSVTNYTLSLCHLMEWEPGLQFATVSTLAADLGNTAIFCALASGGCLQVLDYETITSADAFAQWAAQRPIDVLKIVPSHLSALLANDARFLLPSRTLILGGEVFPVNLLRQLREDGCSCTIVNHYGPTEATIGILVNILGQLDTLEENNILGAEHTPVPLGLPIANSEAYILDHKLQLVPFEVAGELYLAGAGLSIGYIHQPEQTAERFIPHPFSMEHGTRLYRTGDLARYTREGQIEFIKRRDDQIKLRGYRIELGEIDTILRTHTNVWDAVTVLREDIAGDPRIVSYIAKRQKTELTNKMLRDFVYEQLPGYMVPSAFVILDTLPLTRNGKVDRLLLPPPEQSKDETTLEQALPRSPIEEMLVDIWKDILGVTSIGIHDDFFRLGGHSLLATQLIARVRSVTQTDVSILRLFKAPTIAGLAMCIEQALRGEQELDIPALAPMPRTLALPLSFAQQRLWLLHQLDPESTAYLLPMAQWIEGPLSVVALERSLQALIERHEILRTTFPLQNGSVVQFIHPSSVFCLPLIDLRALDEATRNHEVLQLCNQDARVPFDLSCEPLLRAYLLRVNDQRHVWSLTMHHIISDGWSNPILHREMMILYQSFVAGVSSPLEPLPVQYADFALWQRQWLQGALLDRQLAYWRSQLEGVQALELPADRPRPPVKTYSGALQTLSLPASLCDDLRAMSQREHVTLFMLLLAAFQVLLARYSGQQDIAVGTPIANRTHREVEGLIGFFVNTLVLRSQVEGAQSFLQFLEQVREMALGAYAHQDVPFEHLVEMLQPERDLSRTPLFQVMFGFQEVSPLSLPAVSLPTVDLQVHPLSVEHLTTKFDLSLLVISGSTSFSCGVEYNTDLFEAATIQCLLGHWQVLLEAIVVDAHQPVAHLPLLTAAETRRILDEWNDTNGPEPAFASLPQALEAQVGRTPDALALVCEDTCLSYQALFERARGLAWRLCQAGVGPEVLVGVCLERSLELVMGELAIILAGGAYVPLDPASPPERLSFLLQDAGISILFTRKHLLAKVSVPGVQTICLDRGAELLAWKRTEPLTPAVTVQNLAYMIYTSGSTGTPKGVQVQYGGLLNLITWHQRAFAVSPGDRSTLIAAPAFDASVWELWPYLVAGASLAIPTENVRLSPPLLRDWLVSRAISICFLPTPLAEQMLSLAWSDAGALRILLTGGDRLHIHPPCLPFALVNNYGPTENTVVATSGLVLPEEHAERPPSLGRPIARNQVYVLDTFLNPVPVGVVGELYLGGASLARGYWRAAELTSASFIPHPWGVKGERLYRTGDLVRYLSDGNLEFFGRRDAQIKLRGYRIELGEIEEALLGYAGVQSSAVKVWERAKGEQRLQGYVVLKEAEQLRREELFSYLRERLPDYMIPWRIEQLERMPLSSNGKVDYARLEPGAEEQEREAAAGELTPLEELVGQVWSEVLGKKQLDQQMNFFEAGGHSLLATQVVARLRTLLAIELPVRMILETPVLQAFARRVEQELQGKRGLEVPPVLPIVRGEQPVPLSFAQQRLWFLDQLEPGNTAYLIPRRYYLHGVLVPQALERSLQELVWRHEVLRTTFQVQTNQPVQIIHPAKKFLLPYIDISHLPEEEWRSEARRLAQHEALHPCDLQRGPLLRVWLLHLAPEEHLLLITMHHIISDAWSNDVFYRELTALYNACVAGRPSPLEPLPVQYADFAFWQRQWLQGETLETLLAFWMRQLQGSTPLRFPTDYPRPDVPSYRGDEEPFLLPLDLFQSITLLTHQEGCTLFMLLLATFQTLLYRYTDQTDIIVGTDIANRTRIETQFLVGFFVNLLVLRNDLSGAPTFRELLHRTKEMVLDAYTYQDAPFEMLVERLLPDHSLDRMPLVQVLFVLQNQPASQVQQIPGIVTKPFINTGATTAKFDLAVFMQEGPDGLHGVVRYSSDLFKRSSIATLISRFEVLLRDVVTHPDASIDIVNFYADAERIKQAQKEETSLRKLRSKRSEAIHLPEV